jgi:uncharacterized protein (TIGR03437 family)
MWSKRTTILLLCSAAACLQAQTLAILANFNYSNGAQPTAPLVRGSDGNFYGTTYAGGAGGTVFKITPSGTLTSLYDFCAQPSCADGENPEAGLTLGAGGSFYGVTGGNIGTIFKITPSGSLTTLFTLTSGQDLAAGLVQGTDGNFYGTTHLGGASNNGTVFKVTPAGAFAPIYSFDSTFAGGGPYAGLVQGSDGNFYGTTQGGGSGVSGILFKITPGGTLTTVYNFCSLASCTDGAVPAAALTLGSDGNFYGTTSLYGAQPTDTGTIFKVTPSGVLTTLYSFTSNYNQGYPQGALLQATDGNFYGATTGGGANFSGSIYRITPSGVFTTLYSFGATPTDGATPIGGLVEGTDGNLYGTTYAGGTADAGTVFVLKLGLPVSTIGYPCAVTAPPAITGVDSASAYGGYPYFASGSWLEISGTNLADPNDPRLSAAVNPGQWTAADFNGVNAPTSLDGISVSIDGKPASVWYLSPGQLNVQAPEDSFLGSVAITVTNCGGVTSAPFHFPRQALAPGLLAPPSFAANGTQYLVATFVSDGAYVLNTAQGTALGVNSRPAKPGDQIIAYGIGFGDVTPSIPPGVMAEQLNSLNNPVALSFGSTNATLAYAGLAGNFVGLYEFYIDVPPGLANGDYRINVAQNGIPVPQTSYLSVHN